MSGASLSQRSIMGEVEEIKKELRKEDKCRDANMLDMINFDRKVLFEEDHRDLFDGIKKSISDNEFKYMCLTGKGSWELTSKIMSYIEEISNDYKKLLFAEAINCMTDNIITSDVDGAGHRLVIFVPGCSHNCKGCQNKELQTSHNVTLGNRLYRELKEKISSMNIINGITISGGDPLNDFGNMKSTAAIIHIVKLIEAELNKELNIWIYTGAVMCSWKDIESLFAIGIYADVIVDGPYIEGRPNAIYRGSNNQRLIDVKKSWDKKEICFVDESTLI